MLFAARGDTGPAAPLAGPADAIAVAGDGVVVLGCEGALAGADERIWDGTAPEVTHDFAPPYLGFWA